MVAINTLPHAFCWPGCRHQRRDVRVLPEHTAPVLHRMSKRVLLSNECLLSGHRNLDFFFFFPCNRLCCWGRGARRDHGDFSALGPSSSQLGNHLKMMTQLLPDCQVWVLCGNGGMQLFDSCIPPGFPAWVERKRPRMPVIRILLCSGETKWTHRSLPCCQCTVLCLMPMRFSSTTRTPS